MSAVVVGLSVPGQERLYTQSAGFNCCSFLAKQTYFGAWTCLYVVRGDTQISSEWAGMNISSSSQLAVGKHRQYPACIVCPVWIKQKIQWQEKDIKPWCVIISCLPIVRVCPLLVGDMDAAGEQEEQTSLRAGRKIVCCWTWCFIKALICWTCFCFPGAVRVAHKHTVVLWYPVVSQESCCLVCSFIRWADQCLLHHGRQHGWLEAEASWPGIEKCSAKNMDRKWEEGKHELMWSLQWLSAALLAGVPIWCK